MQLLNRELSREGLDRRDLEVCVEGLVVTQDAPGNAGELVGQCDGEIMFDDPEQARGWCAWLMANDPAWRKPGVE